MYIILTYACIIQSILTGSKYVIGISEFNNPLLNTSQVFSYLVTKITNLFDPHIPLWLLNVNDLDKLLGGIDPLTYPPTVTCM